MTFDEWEKAHRPTWVKATLDRGEPIFICELGKGVPLAILDFSELSLLKRKMPSLRVIYTLRR